MSREIQMNFPCLTDEDKKFRKVYKTWKERQKERELAHFDFAYEEWRDEMIESHYGDERTKEEFFEKQGYYPDEQALFLASILDIKYETALEQVDDLIDNLKRTKELKKELKKELPKKIEGYRCLSHEEARLECFLQFLNRSSFQVDEMFLEQYQHIAGGYYGIPL